jgi:hypothetical protein
MRTTLPDDQFAIVPGTSHGLPLEKPELRRSGTPGIIGSTGVVRSRAWICGFSSMLKTAAFAGGARYRPTTSRI